MAELVYALVLGTSGATLGSSSLPPSTLDIYLRICYHLSMKKINKNLIISALGILAVFIVTASVTKEVNAYWSASTAHDYNYSYSGPAYTYNYSGGANSGYINNSNNTNTTGNTGTTTGQISTSGINPIPTISQISPSKAPANTEVLTITVTGSKFIVGSIGRVNGENRTTNYVYEKINGVNRFKSTVLTMDLTKEDLSSGKPLTITVFNPAPGGGTSNSITFNDKENKNNSDLAAGAIFGSDGFMPKTFVQWIMLIVLIIIGVVLFRKASKRKEKYHSTPLKHS